MFNTQENIDIIINKTFSNLIDKLIDDKKFDTAKLQYQQIELASLIFLAGVEAQKIATTLLNKDK